MPIPRPEERIGTVLASRYRVDAMLGSGGMGAVYAGTSLEDGQKIALKVLFEECAEDPVIVRRLFREAKAASMLHHPNVIDVYDSGISEDGAPFLVLELLSGGNLADRLKAGAATPADALAYLLPIADALVHAHAAGILHRDVKPGNVMLHRDASGKLEPKLVDFGITKLLAAQASIATAAGTMLGTPQYMSPEQVRARGDIGPPTDVWSMGVVLFEALAGQRPFDSNVPILVLTSIATEDAPALSSVAPGVPAPLAEVVDGALKRDVAQRWTSMPELLSRLVTAARAAAIPVEDPRLR